MNDWIADYEALHAGAGLIDLGHRTQIELTGPDRATFLHNLCTNEIRRLAPGAGREVFLTNVQGKTLGHGVVFSNEQALVFESVAGQAETALQHLDHYLVCEQVTLADRSQEWSELFLGGARADAVLSAVGARQVPQEVWSSSLETLAGVPVWLRRVAFTQSPGFLLSVESAQNQQLHDALVGAGAMLCRTDALEAARIEAGWPHFGHDLSENNLPQEVGRDALAISFVKGCYLGQETVARIDALGHVNKTLVGLRFASGSVPTPGTELTAGGTGVGSVTSASFSPKLNTPLALGYIRRGSNSPGTRLNASAGDVEVVALPLAETPA